MEYFLTSEFWWNILWGGLTILCCLITIIVFFKITAALLHTSFGCAGILIAVLGAEIPFVLGVGCLDKLLYPRLWEENRGPVIVLAKETPLLHNYFSALGRSLSHTNEQIQKLNTERDNSTTEDAKKVYETQIAQQENRKKELENMRYRIGELAQRLYFSKYLARLGHISADKDIERKLEEAQKACELLLQGE